MLAGLTSCAQAAAIQDLDAWSVSFAQAARTTDVEAMVTMIRQVSPEEFAPAKMTESLTQVRVFMGDSTKAYAESFDAERFGTFARRVNVAVVGPTRQVYYSVFFTRRPQGWMMDNLTFNNHLAEVLKVRWSD